jgi:uncharacterized membrane protein YphA (DoxX/SURF4 family)
MNIILWILQVVLALHTGIGAVWKFSNSEQTVPSLEVIPHRMWMAMSVVEVLCGVGLILPFIEPLAILAPIAAACIAAEMLLLCGLHLVSSEQENGPMIYWLVVAAISAFIVYGRLVLAPL